MITAILYASNTGFTKQYAEMMAKATGLPAYNIKNSIPPAVKGKEVIYMGWLMAGGVQGYKKAKKAYDVRALCAVGMASVDQDQTAGIKKSYGITDMPVFYMQGGFDMKKLRGIYKLMMQVMVKKIMSDLPAPEMRTEEQKKMYEMATVGLNCVSEENLAPVLEWYKTEQ